MKRKRDNTDLVKTANRLSATDFKRRYFTDNCIRSDNKVVPSKAIQLYVSPAAAKISVPSERLSDAVLESCLSLVEDTSGTAYKNSSMGWHRGRKRREMRDRDMRYLIVGDGKYGHDEVIDDQFKLSGFSSFMVTYEDGIPVVYVYEIHLTADLRGMGYGKRLMDTIEKIAQLVSVEKTMLTVFRSNMQAIKWYEQLGYSVDEYSPPDKKLRGDVTKQADYLILSKPLLLLDKISSASRDGAKSIKGEDTQ